MNHFARSVVMTFVALGIGTTSARPAFAQCTPQWERFAGGGIQMRDVYVLLGDDTIAGAPRLVAGGTFNPNSPATSRFVSEWDGEAWHDLGNGIGGAIEALAVFDDDGSGPNPPALYAAGGFIAQSGATVSNVARWDGANWVHLGSGANFGVYALSVYDADGAGPGLAALYAGGMFTTIDGVAASCVARWNGTSWSPVGAGTNGWVAALEVHDDDESGPNPPALYAGGPFTIAGTVPASSIAKWDGVRWSALGDGLSGQFGASVGALCVFDDDGGGPNLSALFAAGHFTTAGSVAASSIAKWDGQAWSALGEGVDGGVVTLAAFDADGAGPAPSRLYAGGYFASAGIVDVQGIAAWDGASWSALQHPWELGPDVNVLALTVFDEDGPGARDPALFAGIDFGSMHQAHHVARFDGASWSPLGDGTNGSVRALAMFDDDGAGPRPPAVFAAGRFTTAGETFASRIAKRDGDTWTTIGSGVESDDPLFTPSISALAVFDEPGASPPALFVGGVFEQIGGVVTQGLARWNEASWSAVGGGSNGSVHAFAVFDADGVGGAPPALYVGGGFTSVGGVAASRVAKWDGVAWSPLGSGVNNVVYALTVFDDDGPGPHAPALYAGGSFGVAGSTVARQVAKWDGTTWSQLAGGTDNSVFALCPFDADGPGPEPPALYVGGKFSQVSGPALMQAIGIARWNGSSWSPLGDGTGGSVSALTTFDVDGSGPQLPVLVVGGHFTTAVTNAASHLARWDGVSWSALGGGIDGAQEIGVYALLGVDADGSGPDVAKLYVGGAFRSAGGAGSDNIAAWAGCGSTFESFCFGDGTLTTACPCTPPNTVPNPPAAIGHGCANSLNLDGARMFATGTTTPDTVQFEVDVAPLYAGFGFISKGNAFLANGEAASDGIRCTSGQLLRFGGHNAGTNGAPIGTWTYPNSVQTLSVSAASAQPLGQTAYYQLFYRNAAASFCNASTANFSSGVKISWQ